MKSRVTDDFRECFARLPKDVQTKARRNYRLWQTNTSHPSLQFKPIHSQAGVFSVRVGIGWRALGYVENDAITWFWIGSHAEYDKLIG